MHCGSLQVLEGFSFSPCTQCTFDVVFLSKSLKYFPNPSEERRAQARLCCSPRPVKQHVGGCFASCRFRFLAAWHTVKLPSCSSRVPSASCASSRPVLTPSARNNTLSSPFTDEATGLSERKGKLARLRLQGSPSPAVPHSSRCRTRAQDGFLHVDSGSI